MASCRYSSTGSSTARYDTINLRLRSENDKNDVSINKRVRPYIKF